MRRSSWSGSSRTPPRCGADRGRRGLAPLELVLSLPILLLVMALMMIFGTIGTWKIRTMANSREAAFRALEPRHGNGDANPPGWPTGSEMAFNNAGPDLMPNDPFAQDSVVRGPVVSDNGSGQSLPVHTQLLDMTTGIRHGHSRIERPFPLLQKMPPHRIDSQRETVIVDGTLWQYETMGIWSNVERRVLHLYDFQLQQRAPSQCMNYAQAAAQIGDNPRKEDLSPIEGNDPEILQLVGVQSRNFFPPGTTDQIYWFPVRYRTMRIPDVGGRVPSSCTMNEGEVQQAVTCYVQRIEKNLLHTLAQDYINYYESAKRSLEGVMPQNPALQRQIQDLDSKIQALRQFDGTIGPPSNCSLTISTSS